MHYVLCLNKGSHAPIKNFPILLHIFYAILFENFSFLISRESWIFTAQHNYFLSVKLDFFS